MASKIVSFSTILVYKIKALDRFLARVGTLSNFLDRKKERKSRVV